MYKLINRWKNLHQPNVKILKCNICDHTNDISSYKKYICNDMFYAGQLVRYQCPNCDVIFGDLRFLNLDLSIIAEDYTDLYSFYNEGDTSKYILHIFNLLNYKNDRSYLDYACGKWNNTINILEKLNYTIHGYDKYVHSGQQNILNDISGKKFDVIYSSNYIEHVIDPINDLAILVDHLNDNGQLLFITGCFEYRHESSHYHTYFFLGRSINILCQKLGIKLILSEKIKFDDGDETIIKIFTKI